MAHDLRDILYVLIVKYLDNCIQTGTEIKLHIFALGATVKTWDHFLLPDEYEE
jgi:hypothetical protein